MFSTAPMIQTVLNFDIGAPDEACNMLGMQKWQPRFPMCLGLVPETPRKHMCIRSHAHTHTCDEDQKLMNMCGKNWLHHMARQIPV